MDKVINSRHIRHDWQTFVDWEQVSVRTMCNSTTRRGLAGIPGVTEQGSVVNINGKVKWGWCTHCVRATLPIAVRTYDSVQMVDSMKQMYAGVIFQIGPQADWITKNGLRAARQAERDGVQ